MPVIPLTAPYILKSATFVVVADDYTAALSQVQFDPAVTPAAFVGINGTTTKDVRLADWTCTLTLAQDLTPSSLLRYLLANQGTAKAVQFIPKSGGPTITATVTIVPGALGGSADGNFVTATVQLPVTGTPAFVDAPFVPVLASALPSGAAAGANVVIRSTTGGFLTVSGAAGVKFNAINATSYIVIDDYTIVAVLPAGSAGSAPIIVTNAAGASAPLAYTRA